ncbi:MAG: trigger factor [Nitrospirae bacterium]|nr:trigger factor [Nitrospirota bacterium]MCL5236596.1 trigger factor [Nitrospirota bacterium]
MLKALEDISSTKKRLKIEIPAETIEAEIKKGLLDVQRKSKLPGFRPGKAPMTMIEKKFGRNVEADVLERMVPEFYMAAVREADIKPVSGPVVEESFDFQRNIPLSMTIMVDVRPKVENLNYEDIPVKDIPIEVIDAEVDSVLKNLAEEKAAYEAVDDGINTGDLVTVDYTVKSAGTADNPHWDSTAKDVVLKVGSGPYPQEFFDGLTGKRKDEEFELEAAFPEDLQSPFAGKKPKFEIKIKDIKRRNVAAVDDEFAKDLGLENAGQLRDRVRENIITVKNREADRAKQKEILDKLLESHSFDAPESLLDAEIKGIIDEIKSSGKDNRPDEELLAELRPHAEKSVKASILLELIGEKEGITVKEEDVKEEVLAIARRFYISPENVIKYYVAKDGSLEGLKRTVFEKKVLNFLLGKAKIEK